MYFKILKAPEYEYKKYAMIGMVPLFGAFWKSLDPDCCWGGDFNDGNHYSIAYQGRK